MKNKNNIILQMFDVRPIDSSGVLDWEKIRKVSGEKVLERMPKKIASSLHSRIKKTKRIRKEKRKSLVIRKIIPTRKPQTFQLGRIVSEEEVRQSQFIDSDWAGRDFIYFGEEKSESKKEITGIPAKRENFAFWRVRRFIMEKMNRPGSTDWNLYLKKPAFVMGTLVVIALATGLSVNFWQNAQEMKGRVLGVSDEAYNDLDVALAEIKAGNFDSSSKKFQAAYQNFSQASAELEGISEILIKTSGFFPYLSKISSGKNAVEAGKHISLAGEQLNAALLLASSLNNPLEKTSSDSVSLLDIFTSVSENLALAEKNMKIAEGYLNGIKVSDLPEDKREKFIEMKSKMSYFITLIGGFSEKNHIIVDLLGGNGPRKYLFLFQNNQEARATGGFIGSYGLLDIYQGRMRDFFVDGIFNPDGQLVDKIIPPLPIQKISAVWSLHDSNWFPDFPLSAKKAVSFYEKTGGPTVDGVITFTSQVMQELLRITGPVAMEEYGVILDEYNFIEKTQFEVELDYDKEENNPKKILSDLAPIILQRIFETKDPEKLLEILAVFGKLLDQKHILIYFQNEELQKIISQRGWSGEILETPKDYLSVVNSNINGYKTDGVIKESIRHKAEIQPDGAIIDTVTITRHHNGGDSQYDWWNRVNADYMRVYVPKGSKLLKAKGHTREVVDPPLDYEALGFERDADVVREENNAVIDEESGTRIYEESGKTVFANWIYASPQETAVIEYEYLLPFKISLNEDRGAESYSLLTQKQSGSVGSWFASFVSFPENYSLEWKYPDDMETNRNSFQWKGDLKTDKFFGVVFTKKE